MVAKSSRSLDQLSHEGIGELLKFFKFKIIEIDAQGKLSALSEAASESLNLAEAMIGSTFLELPSRPGGALDVLQKCYEELKQNKDGPKPFQRSVLSLDGTETSWNFRLLPSGACLVISGIDEQSEFIKEQIEHTMKLVQDQKRALDVSSIVAITDQRGVITYVNETFCRISGYSRAELIGTTHRLVSSGYHEPSFFQDLWRTIQSGKVWKGEICNRAKNGRIYWVDTTIVPFIDVRTQKPYQYVAIRTDITAQKDALEFLNQERMKSWHAEKMVGLGEMAAGIAHELGNPIASIQAWLDVMESQLSRGMDDLDKFLKTLPKVRHDAHRIRDIIRGMLTYARDGSRDPFRSENLSQMIKLVQDYCSYKLRKLQVGWHFFSENPYLEIECRLSEMTQVFVNFVLNACDAMAEIPERWIKIDVIDRVDNVEIRFADHGHGIPVELRDKIWDPFFTTKPVGSGTGLGLSITRSIIESHGGQVELDITAKDTCFVIQLPKKQLR